jgi:hypothetical protein
MGNQIKYVPIYLFFVEIFCENLESLATKLLKVGIDRKHRNIECYKEYSWEVRCDKEKVI